MSTKNNISNILNWEYWPTSMFYIPNIPFALYHAMKARHLVFFTAVNPSIENSGIGTESKFQTLNLIPEKYLPKTVFHKANSKLEVTLTKIQQEAILYPLIAKPDIGFKGLLVKKIASEKELIAYLEKYPIDLIIQEFLTESNECGIFYHRLPNEEKGKITSITLKEFLHIVGDGKHTLKELILLDKRAKNYYELLQNNLPIPLDTILDTKEKIKLSDIGNHCKGTQFINGNHLISKKLESVLDNLNKQVDGWFYGRLDIKYNSFEDLENDHFKILELNGILAEPTHIYDAEKMTYFQALREIRTHWKQLYKIARINHDVNKIPYRSTFGLIKEVNELKKYTKNISKLS